MQFHLSLIAPQGSLNFRGTFPLICPQKPCMTTSRSGGRICVLLHSSRPLCMELRRENLKVPRRLCQCKDIAGRTHENTSTSSSFCSIWLQPWRLCVTEECTSSPSGRDESPSYQPPHRILQCASPLGKISTAKAVNIFPLAIMHSVAVSFCLPLKMCKPREQRAIPCLQVLP